MKLDEEIQNLNRILLKMSDIVEQNLKIAFDLIDHYDEEQASLIIDDLVDAYERLVEETSMTILLKERPFASDMRKVLGTLKLVEDLERLGDHAEDVRDFSKKLKDCKKVELNDLTTAINKTMTMVHDSVHSLINNDMILAAQVIKDDDIIDNLYNQLIEDIIIKETNREIESRYAIYITLVVKYIERIGDHAVNVAEWVIYILSGYHKDKQIF